MESNKCKIIIIEDNPDMLLVLETYLQDFISYEVRGVFNSCEEALDRIDSIKPQLILMDIDLPGMSGIEGTKRIKRNYPNIEVLIITVFENSESVFAALNAGATGYLTKTFNKNALHQAIEECLAGGAPMSMKIAKLVVSSFTKNNNSPLSQRETEVLTLLSKGQSYKSAAEKLFISIDTVKFHIKNIYIKLQANSKAEAIDIATKKRYI